MTHKHNNPFKKDINEDKAQTEELNETSESSESINNEPEESKNDELAKLQAKYDELNNQYIRLAADFDNYRKRQEQERESLYKLGTENTLKKLLEVLDNFERGEKALENVEDCAKCKESFSLVHKQVVDSLTKLGLETIDAEGQTFDPNFHEAVMQTPTSEHPEHTIITELQKGYKLGDKVLRPSLVNVAISES